MDTVNNFKVSYLNPLSQYTVTQPCPTELIPLIDFEKNVSTKLQQIQAVVIPPINFDPTLSINEYYAKLTSNEESKAASIRKEAEQKRSELDAEHSRLVSEATQYNADLLIPIRQKHEELLSKRDQFKPIFDRYEITPLDIKLSDNLTFEEFSTLVEESIKVCHKYEEKNSELFNRIIQPLKDQDNLYIIVAYLAILFIASFIALPVIAIPAFVKTVSSVHNLNHDLEKLRIARALMAQIDYNRFVCEDDKKTVDTVDYSEIDAEMEERLEAIVDYSEEQKKALEEASQDLHMINTLLQNAYAEVKGKYAEVISNLTNLCNEARKRKEELMSKLTQFPDVQKDSLVMSRDYILSRKNNVIDVPVTLPLLNIIFDASKREESINIMKLYLANAMLSVRVKQLSVEIYDPKNMGGDFTEFVTLDTKDYIKINQTELSKIMSTYRKYAQENVLELNKMTIDEFNRDAEARELVPKEYRLLLLISDFKDLREGKDGDKWLEFVKFSAAQGVMIWILDTVHYQNTVWVSGNQSTVGEPIKYTPELGKRAMKTFGTALAKYKDRGIDYITKFGNVFIPKEKWWTFDTIKGIKMPFGLEKGDPTRGLNVAPELGDANVHALLGGATGAGKSAAINQLLISLITMYPPSELLIIYIDFKNVEAAKFTAGYEPEKGQWMDKEREEELRKKGEYYTRMSSIPHLKIISGTTDGEYALSVFEYLMAEMAHRQEIINKYGVTKIQSMREDILDKYNKSHGTPNGTWADMRRDWDWYKPNVYDVYGDLPRLLVIFDEFQVMYNPEFVDSKVIDQINGKITAFTKLARAMSAHFWFTSQSMKGTMSKDTMANFSLRGALRCTSDVSEELLGNPAAGTIKSKFGFMYTNDTAGQDKDANRLWRVPFLADTHKEDDTREFRDMFDYVAKVNELLEPFNEKSYMAEFYDEKVLVPATILSSWYMQYDVFKSPDVFILGERANYSTNKAPVTMSLQEDTGENVLVAAFSRDDLLNLTMTFIKNLKESNPDDYTLIMNVQDPESYTLLDVENLVDDAFLPLASPRQDIRAFIDALDKMVTAREEKGGPYKPVYVVCVQWERAPGIGSDPDYKLHDIIKSLMRRAPAVGVHFIMCIKDKMDLPRSIPGACNHRVCGQIPKDAFFFIETPKVEKLPDKSKDCGLFAFYEFGTSLTKFRIYQHVFSKQVKSRDIVL